MNLNPFNKSAEDEAPKKTTSTVYIAVRGLNYGDPEVRVEPGQEARNLPAADIEWLLAHGHIRPKENK